MEAFVLDNLDTYGPIAVFLLLMLSGVGLALGEEMVIIPAGVFIATGRLDLLPTLIAAYAGIVLADSLWFGICRHYGTPLLHRRWFKKMVHPRRLLETKHQLERRGAWLIVMARFIPSSRTTAITVAGMFHMPFWKFAVANTACVIVTAPIQLGLGYLIGRGIGTESLADLLVRLVGLIALIVAVTLGIGWFMRHRARRRRLPRAKASWLRRFRPRRTARVVSNGKSNDDDNGNGNDDDTGRSTPAVIGTVPPPASASAPEPTDPTGGTAGSVAESRATAPPPVRKAAV